MRWWLGTLGGALLGATILLFSGFVVALEFHHSMPAWQGDALYFGSVGIGAGLGAALAGGRHIWPWLLATLLGTLAAASIIAAVRRGTIDLTGSEPVVVVLSAGLAATVGARVGRGRDEGSGRGRRALAGP